MYKLLSTNTRRYLAGGCLCFSALAISHHTLAQTDAKIVVNQDLANHQLPKNAPIAGQVSLDGHVIDGAYYVNAMWVLPAENSAQLVWVREPTQANEFLETMAFIGSDPENPEDLNGEVEIWLGNEKHTITKSSVVFFPAGLIHGPIIYRNLTKPIREIKIAATEDYQVKAVARRGVAQRVSNRAESEYGYLIYDKMNPRYEGLEPNVATNNLINRDVPGANYFDSGLIKQNPANPDHNVVYGYRGTHRHNEGETFFFLGTDPSRPDYLGAELDVMVGGKTYRIDKPSLVYVAPDTTHVPISYLNMQADVWEAMTGPLPHQDWGFELEPNSGAPGVIYTDGVQVFGGDPNAFMNDQQQ